MELKNKLSMKLLLLRQWARQGEKESNREVPRTPEWLWFMPINALVRYPRGSTWYGRGPSTCVVAAPLGDAV